MISFPLPATIRASKVLPKENEYLVNSYAVDGKVLSRPGHVVVAANAGNPRGAFEYGGAVYYVQDQTMRRYVPSTATDSAIGEVNGIQPVQVAKGFTHAAICSPGMGNYKLSIAGVLTQITDTDLPSCVDVERLDGYFLWVPANGDPVIFSAVNDAGDIDPLDYFDAEVSPDVNLGVLNFRNDLFVFGSETIERFRNTGTAAAPFLRVSGGMIPVGYVGGKVRVTDTFLWLGKEPERGFGFFAYINGSAQRISTPAVDEILQTEYTATELAAVKPQVFNWRGAQIIIWTLPRHSLCFSSGWSYWQTGVAAVGAASYDVQFAVQSGETVFAGSSAGLVKLTEDNTDAGEPIDRRIVTFVRQKNGQAFNASGLSLDISQGQSTGTVGLRVSRDGKRWSHRFYRQLGKIGHYDQRLVWSYPGGLGQYDAYMGIEISTGSDCVFAADGATIGIEA